MMTTAELANIIKPVLPNKTATRPELLLPYFAIADGKATLTATDSYMLARVEYPSNNPIPLAGHYNADASITPTVYPSIPDLILQFMEKPVKATLTIDAAKLLKLAKVLAAYQKKTHTISTTLEIREPDSPLFFSIVAGENKLTSLLMPIRT